MALVSVACLNVSTGYSQTLFSENFENGMDRWIGRFQGPTTACAVDDPLNSGHGKVMWFGGLSSGGDAFTRETIAITSKVLIEFDYLGINKPGSITNDLGGFFGIANDFDASTLQNWLATTSSGFTNSVQLIDDGQWHHVTVNLEPYSISPFHLVLQDYMYSWGVPGDVYFDNITVSYPSVKTVVPPIPGMTGWWQGEDNAVDSIGTNHGAIQGSSLFGSSKVGKGFVFDNDYDRIFIPHSSKLNPSETGFSVEFWMKGIKNQPDEYFDVIDKSHGWTDSTGWVFEGISSSGIITFGIGLGDDTAINFADVSSKGNVLDGIFHHIAGTWDGKLMQLYVDGVLHDSVAVTNYVNNSRDLYLGCSFGGQYNLMRFFRGSLDELSIYNRALTSTEIIDIYTYGTLGKSNIVISPSTNTIVPSPHLRHGWLVARR